MTSDTAIGEISPGHFPHLTVDVHYGRFLTLDQGVAGLRARIKRDMPHFNFEALMAAGDRWVLTVRDSLAVCGMAVFSGARETPMMDFYYATDPASAGALMGAISQWRRVRARTL